MVRVRNTCIDSLPHSYTGVTETRAGQFTFTLFRCLHLASPSFWWCVAGWRGRQQAAAGQRLGPASPASPPPSRRGNAGKNVQIKPESKGRRQYIPAQADSTSPAGMRRTGNTAPSARDSYLNDGVFQGSEWHFYWSYLKPTPPRSRKRRNRRRRRKILSRNLG